MRRLLMRADDLGYSEAVNHGIAKAASGGLLGGIGFMTNMPASEHGFELLKDSGVVLGQHTNICIGRPLTDPALIPSLVDENGFLKRSSVYRSAEEDFVVYEEVLLEVRAQLARFREITGRDPGYFEGHAVRSDNFFRALEDVAREEGLKYCGGISKDHFVHVGETDVCFIPIFVSDDPSYDAFQHMKDGVLATPDGCTCCHISHPGYLDDFILRNSSNKVNRTREVEMLISPETRAWIESQDIELIDYDAL